MKRIRKKRRVRRLVPTAVRAVIALPLIAAALGGVASSGSGAFSLISAVSQGAVPHVPEDKGAGENVLLVVGGTYSTRDAAQDAANSYVFGDLQGYYVVPVGAFQGFKEGIGSPGDWAIVSAFRTRDGAEEFQALGSTLGIPARIVGPVVSKGVIYAGLGQEADPNGVGPLDHPLSPAQQAALR